MPWRNPTVVEAIALKAGVHEYLPIALEIVVDACLKSSNRPPEETRRLAYMLVGRKYYHRQEKDPFLEVIYEKYIGPFLEDREILKKLA